MSNKSIMSIFILFGVVPTALALIYHETLCKYDMNPLCFFVSCLPLIICLPLLALKDADFK
ncbi:MAG: hypothetical protein IKG76_00930 [Firmicutes bacterium]|nr:hypothetical protein [Bacillota bacterium]